METFSNAFDEGGLARAQLAAKQYELRWSKGLGQGAPESNRLFCRVGDDLLRAHADPKPV
jgi:hypothetical protein